MAAGKISEAAGRPGGGRKGGGGAENKWFEKMKGGKKAMKRAMNNSIEKQKLCITFSTHLILLSSSTF